MYLPSKAADLALAELRARRDLDDAHRSNDRDAIWEKTRALARAEAARREL